MIRQWQDTGKDPLREELRLLVWDYLCGKFDRRKKSPWPKRCDEWEVHATGYAYIACGPPAASEALPPAVPPSTPATPPKFWKAERITFLSKHLDVLDSKLGMLLNFNSLLLIAINVLYAAFYNLVKEIPSFLNLKQFSAALIVALAGLSVVFGALWLAITILCLVGGYRVYWGDLGRGERDRHYSLEELNDPALPAAAEEKHVESLIVSIVRRTSRFRIASMLTFVNVAVLAITFLVGLLFLGEVNLSRFEALLH